MKTCCRCKTTKDESEFHDNALNDDGLQKFCKTCKSEIAKVWYGKVKKKHKEIVRARGIEKRRFVYDYLSKNPCVDCKESDPVVLEFDHVRGTKFLSISKMLCDGYSTDALKDEIAKCDVRCCNCHRRKTSKQFNHFRLSCSITDNALVS